MKEIERKFLVHKTKWKPKEKGSKMKQGYLSVDPNRTVRVRIVGELAFLTIKGISVGISRTELEYEIPKREAEILMGMCLDHPIARMCLFSFFLGLVMTAALLNLKNLKKICSHGKKRP